MFKVFCSLVLTALSFSACFAQASGNIAYSQSGGKARAEQEEASKRVITHDELPPNGTSTFVDANVLMNVRADQFVAVFGITEEGATLAECARKMDAAVTQFLNELRPLGIPEGDAFVDYVAQNRIYGYRITGDVAKQERTGFELKKNVSIHYRDQALLDRLILAASAADIYDLIKVDYVVTGTNAVMNRLMDEASRIVKQKAARYGSLLGIRLVHPVQVYAARHGAYFPADMYDSYTAYESEDVTGYDYRQKYLVEGARKNTTFFYNALSAKGFDTVINPVVLEPVVQFTLYLKVRYDTSESRTTEARPQRRLERSRAAGPRSRPD